MKQSLLALALIATPAAAQQAPLQQRVEAALAEAVPGTRFGLVVVDADGKEIVAVNPDQRFIPASNTKMFTTAATFWTLDVNSPDATGGASVRLEGRDVVLEGHGDARLSSADDCKVDCLATLADAIAARTKRVHDVIGDDSFYPDERWSPGMSWNNIPTRYGTGISALTIDDNEVWVNATPGAAGTAPKIDGSDYYTFDNRVVTVAGGKTAIGFDRMPMQRTMRLTGTIAAGAAPEVVKFGVDDPAHYAAWRLRKLLEARGVKVMGSVTVRHRPLSDADDPEKRGAAPAVHVPQAAPLARLTPAPLVEDLTVTNKVSQNLHAELFIRRVGYKQGSGSIADGQAVVSAMLTTAGVPRTAYDFSDGSGMSSYNRIAPRGTVMFLRWVAAQPWGEAWRATLPIGGVDGTLSRRFKGTPLEGRVFAKTGTLNASNAISGYMIAKSGKVLTFSALANDVPQDAGATKYVDAALVIIAEAN